MKTEIIFDKDGTPMINLDQPKKNIFDKITEFIIEVFKLEEFFEED